MTNSNTTLSFVAFCLVICILSGAAIASEPPDPFNKTFLENPQEYVSLIGVDPENPPEQIELLTEVLQARSIGGNTVFWSNLRNAPSSISTNIPGYSSPNDILLLLADLDRVYGLTDVEQELELRINTSSIPSDSSGYIPPTNYSIFQHVCRFADGTKIDVSGSRFYATIDLSGHLMTLSSTYKPIDCVYPEGLLSENVLHQMYPGITSIITKEILPPNTINSVLGGTYIYRFSTNDTYYEVYASDGAIINSYPTKLNSHGMTRKVKDTTNAPETIKCEDTFPNSASNSSGGSNCIDPFSHMYNSLYWAVFSWNGAKFFNDLLGKTVNWGAGNKLTIDADYNIDTGNSTDTLGFYTAGQDGKISFHRWANVNGVGLQGVNAITRSIGSQSQPLPGLGGAIDLVSHEVGHGYIAAFLKMRDENTGGVFASGSGAYRIGSAITEGLADLFGKVAEAHARYSNSNCSPTISSPPIPNCGQVLGVTCGSKVCGYGEFCNSNNKCQPCHIDCPVQSPAIINWNFATKYIDGENIFQNADVFGRKIWDQTLWSIDCHWGSGNTDNIQLYGNSLWLSGLISSYSTAIDPLFANNIGFIRNIYDITALEAVLRHTMKHIPSRPTAYGVFSAYATGLLLYIQMVPYAVWNSPAIQQAAGIALSSSKSWRSGGKCQDNLVSSTCQIDPKSCCSSTSPYICTRRAN